MDGFERAEKYQAAATALGTLVALVPAASLGGNIFIAILAALGVGSLAGGAVMVWWLRTDEGDAYLRADSRISGRSTSRTSLWLGNLPRASSCSGWPLGCTSGLPGRLA